MPSGVENEPSLASSWPKSPVSTMYFAWLKSPTDHVVFSVTGSSPETARHALSVWSQVALAGSSSSGSAAAPAGLVDPENGDNAAVATSATATIKLRH